MPVTVRTLKSETLVEADEGPRRDTSLEQLAKLKPVFKQGGTVTAGNSSSLNDGAAAVLIVSAPYARAHGLKPMARVRSIGVAGVPPRVMGIGPVLATRKALLRAGVSLADVGLVELNEAFAAQSLAVLHEWGMDPEDERLNPNGGAIAIGHPLGCSGVRILTTLLYEMGRRPDVELGWQRCASASGRASRCLSRSSDHQGLISTLHGAGLLLLWRIGMRRSPAFWRQIWSPIAAYKRRETRTKKKARRSRFLTAFSSTLHFLKAHSSGYTLPYSTCYQDVMAKSETQEDDHGITRAVPNHDGPRCPGGR